MDSENITKVELMRHGNVRIQEARKKTWRMGLCLRYGYTLVPFTEAKEGDLWGLVLWLQEMSLDLEVFMEHSYGGFKCPQINAGPETSSDVT